jgi:uncharacterized protein with von Willebrand factor type A (vWA) domain
MLAVVKTGAAYVPIDPAVPEARMQFVLDDASPVAVLTTADFVERLTGRDVRVIDIGDRRQVHAALRATMVHKHEQFEVFDQAFQLFWRDPEAARHAGAMEAMEGLRNQPEKMPPASRRLAEAMQQNRQPPTPPKPPEERPPVEMAMSECSSRLFLSVSR